MIPERYASQTYALMRLVFGLMFLTYGVQKFGMLGGVDGAGGSAPFLSWPFGVAGVIEVIVGLLVSIGLFTKPAAFLGAGEMAVAYFMVHQPNGGLPVQNMGIPAVLFCFAFLYIATRGAGIWSADAAMGGGRSAGTAARV
jgi:putative oxidoreductase